MGTSVRRYVRMGKGWAKGLTAATDPRVARRAEGHRGKLYVRRTPLEKLRWSVRTATTLPLAWSDPMAYVVGLTATDGCLTHGRRRSINFKSEDFELVSRYLALLGWTNTIGVELTREGNVVYHTQFGDARLYEWFRSVGLMPRKSLVLGAIDVPDSNVSHLVRGLLDGDGSILNYMYEGTGKARGTYEALRTVFNSASRAHVEWLRERLRSQLGIWGSIGTHQPSNRIHPMHRLAYANRESSRLLPWLYSGLDVPCLQRKRVIWDSYAVRHELDGA
jgi:hypothetical protein